MGQFNRIYSIEGLRVTIDKTDCKTYDLNVIFLAHYDHPNRPSMQRNSAFLKKFVDTESVTVGFRLVHDCNAHNVENIVSVTISVANNLN